MQKSNILTLDDENFMPYNLSKDAPCEQTERCSDLNFFGGDILLRDLHIHIERAPYEVAQIEKFIKKAEQMNIDEICLLEHSVRFEEFLPTFSDAANYSSYQRKWLEGKKKSMHRLDEFKALANEIRAKDYPLKVSFGLEICYFERYADYIRETACDGFFDYLLGSVHWIDNWTFNQRKYQWLGKDVDRIYQRYFELENSLVESGIFDIIAHPDLIRCFEIYPNYDLAPEYEKLCKNVKNHNMLLEMNTLKGLGVNPQFLEAARREGVLFSTGSDAHCVEDVGRNIKEVTELIARR